MSSESTEAVIPIHQYTNKETRKELTKIRNLYFADRYIGSSTNDSFFFKPWKELNLQTQNLNLTTDIITNQYIQLII